MSESLLLTIMAGLGIFIVFFLIFFIAIEVVIIVGKWKLFKKAGKNGWEAIIPFYSEWVVVEIAGLEWWWFLLLMSQVIISILCQIIPAFGLLSFVGLIAGVFSKVSIYMNLSKKLHKDTAFIVLGVLFNDIVLAVAGYSNSYQYDSSVVVSKMGVLDNISSNNNQQNVNPNNATNFNQNTSNVSQNVANEQPTDQNNVQQ